MTGRLVAQGVLGAADAVLNPGMAAVPAFQSGDVGVGLVGDKTVIR
jgi:hypothetical protein